MFTAISTFFVSIGLSIASLFGLEPKHAEMPVATTTIEIKSESTTQSKPTATKNTVVTPSTITTTKVEVVPVTPTIVEEDNNDEAIKEIQVALAQLDQLDYYIDYYFGNYSENNQKKLLSLISNAKKLDDKPLFVAKNPLHKWDLYTLGQTDEVWFSEITNEYRLQLNTKLAGLKIY